MNRMSIRTATPADLPAVLALQAEAVRWLAAEGLDQWQPASGRERQSPERTQQRIADAIGRNDCHVVLDSSHIVATVTVDEMADPEFWSEEDEPGAALYVHRMIVARDHAGRGIGAQLIEFALGLARGRGKKWLRLDAWRTNSALHEYYRSKGFHHVRTVSLPHRGSGSLFQRPTADGETMPDDGRAHSYPGGDPLALPRLASGA